MDDEEEEDYVLFGTPLPEIEDEATLKKKAAKELQVRDEKGRQRFHGAFTGGFSAGFFNTVGTKEGWAPSTFISSRNKVADRIQQNPEDFMDDEDFGEFGIANRKIHTTSNFQDTSVTNIQKRKYVDTENIIPGEAPLKDIIQPVRESIGILILKKLGWRQGQGIGPRVKKYSVDTKIYGCSPFPDSLITEENDPMAVAFTFAPEDTEGMSYQSKDNYFGLGYTGLSKQSVLSASVDSFAPTTTKSWLVKDKRKIKISGQAFGVGAFEDEDEDIYSKDDMSQYDFSDLTHKGSEDSHKAIELQKHGNSEGILHGFCLAKQLPLVKKHYSPPSLPPNFKPIHLKSVCSTTQNVNHSLSHHVLSSSDRSLLLGEKKFQKVPLNEEMQKTNPQQVLTQPSSSSSISRNFQPFLSDQSKQQRYDEYLSLKGKGDVRKLIQPSCMTEWEKQQELEEFAKASVLFKPLSNVLSSRFESRSQLSVEHEVMSALEKIKREKDEKQVVIKKNLVGTSNRKIFVWHPVPLLCKRMNVPNPYPNSSSSGTESSFKTKSVFDHLTIKSDKTESSGSNGSSALPSGSTLESKIEESSEIVSEGIQKQASDAPICVKNIEDLSSEDKRPSMDFFKDIFENSSSEDEKADVEIEASDKPINSVKETLGKNVENFVDDEIGLKNSADAKTDSGLSQKIIINDNQNSSNKKIGFGVFANLDLDALNQRKPKTPEKLTFSDISESNDIIDINHPRNLNNNCGKKEPEIVDVYGPELPPNFSTVDIPVTTPSSSKVSSRKHVKSKSSHKHKHHKHKHKKKKKKKSSSSDSSEGELGDIPPSVIIEKLKKLQKKKS